MHVVYTKFILPLQIARADHSIDLTRPVAKQEW